jgi:hypothetical protein
MCHPCYRNWEFIPSCCVRRAFDRASWGGAANDLTLKLDSEVAYIIHTHATITTASRNALSKGTIFQLHGKISILFNLDLRVRSIYATAFTVPLIGSLGLWPEIARSLLFHASHYDLQQPASPPTNRQTIKLVLQSGGIKAQKLQGPLRLKYY